MTSFRLFVSYAGSLALRFLLSPLKLLPVQKDRVLFLSFRGKQYSCNPRAVSEALEKNASGRVRIEWAFHEPEKFKSLAGRGITVLDDRSLKFILHAMTARVVCTNTYYKPFLPRRKDQFYLRTWHGGGSYKKVTYPSGLRGKYISMQQQGASLYLSSSRAFTDQTLRGAFGYTGEVLEAGMPRNDILTDGRWKETAILTKRELGLSDRKIALYAPTYREGGAGKNLYPDTDRIKKALSQKFGGSWTVLYRGHHVDKSANIGDMDVSAYPDMQPLLCAADALITDYSSSIWDMSLMYKPAFLYCADLDAYRAERDFFTDIRSWPFPLAENDGELENNILCFDEEKYRCAVKAHHESLGNCETGRASVLAAERILQECGALSSPGTSDCL